MGYCNDIKYVYGKLIINKRPVLIETPSDQWTYDGYEKSNDGVIVVVKDKYLPLVDGHSVKVIEKTTVVFAGQYENEVLVIIENDDIDNNYEIEYEKGQLEILKRDITIETASATIVYNGLENYVSATANIINMADTDTLEIIESTACKNVGSYDNVFSQYKILNGTEYATDSYNVTFNNGYITITKRQVLLVANDATKEYDGTYLTESGFSQILLSADDGYGAIPTWHQIKVTMTADSKILDLGVTANVIDTVEILDENDQSVYANYDR